MAEPGTVVVPLEVRLVETFLSFDLSGRGEAQQSVAVRPSSVYAVETDPGSPGTCVLRVTPNLRYRVDAELSKVLGLLEAAR